MVDKAPRSRLKTTQPSKKKDSSPSPLLAGLTALDDYRCVVTIANNLPCEWECVITEIGLRFMFSGDQEVIGRNPNIICRKATEIRSTKNKCCIGIEALIKVEWPGDSQVIQYLYGAPKDQCVIGHGIAIVPADYVSRSATKNDRMKAIQYPNDLVPLS